VGTVALGLLLCMGAPHSWLRRTLLVALGLLLCSDVAAAGPVTEAAASSAVLQPGSDGGSLVSALAMTEVTKCSTPNCLPACSGSDCLALNDAACQNATMLLHDSLPTEMQCGQGFGAQLYGSRSQKIAYVRIGKCGSRMIQALLRKNFDDYELLTLEEISNLTSWRLFTFVRDPVGKAFSGYKEVDRWCREAREERMNLKSLIQPGSEPQRYRTYLDDLFLGKFGVNSESTCYPGHSYPIVLHLCGVLKVDYVGHLETFETEWPALKARWRFGEGVVDQYEPQRPSLPSEAVSDEETEEMVTRYYAADVACFGRSPSL